MTLAWPGGSSSSACSAISPSITGFFALTASFRTSSSRPSTIFTSSLIVRPFTPGCDSIAPAALIAVSAELAVDLLQIGVAVGAVHDRVERRGQRHRRAADVDAEIRRRRRPLHVDLLQTPGELAERLQDAADALDRVEVGVIERVLAVRPASCPGAVLTHGPNVPVVAISPAGIGLVSVAMNGIVRLKPTDSSCRLWIAKTFGSFRGSFGTMISCASFASTRSIRTGPGGGVRRVLARLPCRRGVRGGMVMRRPESSTELNRRCRRSRPNRPPATSKWRISMNGAGFCWPLQPQLEVVAVNPQQREGLDLEALELDFGVELVVQRLHQLPLQDRRARHHEQGDPQADERAPDDADEPAGEPSGAA